MRSRGFKYKKEVMDLRRQGVSMTAIEREFNIPRSTLSGWFKDIQLTETQRTRLMKNSQDGWKKARQKAVESHNLKKARRLSEARNKALEIFKLIPTDDTAVLELSLAMLYFGEGSKKSTTSIGASDPFMLRFFLSSVEKLYGLDRDSFRYDLHLREDQDEEDSRNLWASELKIDPQKIKYVVKDKRTAGKPTKNGYKGVCLITVGDISIQRRLIALYNVYCTEVTQGG